MRTEAELRQALGSIHDVQYEEREPDAPWLETILRIRKMSYLGSNYIHGITAALDWALGEEWEFVEIPAMIEAFRDYH